MTLSRTLLLLAFSAGFSACGGGEPEVTDPTFIPDGDDDDDDETGDSGVGNQDPIAGEVRLLAFFGWDDVLGEITQPEGFRSEFVIQISIQDWSGADDPSQYCTLRIDVEGLTGDPDAVADGWLWAVDIPAGQPYEEDCTERNFDMESNEMRSIEEWVDGPHHLALGGAPNADTLDWLTTVASVPADEIDDYIGGYLEFPSAPEPDGNSDTYWYSIEVDETTGVPLEDGASIDRFSIANDDGELAFGYYNMRQTVYWYYY